MAVLLTSPYLQFFDANGAPLAGGKVNTYTATGTFSTRKATYTTEAGDVEHANPVILNNSGIPDAGNGSIWLTGTYDIVVTDANDVEIESTLNVTAFTTTGESSDAYFESFSGTGSQTEFITSADLGTDEKAIFVWVDAGGSEGYEFQNPSAYTISGTTLTFSSAPASGTNNIYVSSPSSLVGAAASSAADAATSAAAALASETQAGAYAGQLVITSTTSVSIGTGSKVFTVASGLGISAGQFILMASDAAPTANYMWGQIASYSSTTLTVTVLATLGSGSYADWSGYLTGERGATGATGSVSDISGVSTATPESDDTFIFTDISDSNNTKKATISQIGSTRNLQTQTISSDTAIEFINGTSGADFSSTYKEVVFDLYDIVMAVDANSVILTISTDAGVSYKSANYTNSGITVQSNATTVTSNNGSSLGSLSLDDVAAIGNAAGRTFSGTVKITNPSNSSLYKLIDIESRYITQAGFLYTYKGSAMYEGDTDAITAIKFTATGGNAITSGSIVMSGKT